MSNIVIYTTRFCPFCIRAKHLLKNKGLEYKEIPVDNNNKLRREMTKKAGRTSVPQIWIGDRHVGGCDDLYYADSTGELDTLVAPVS